ncbi:hypothetical protein JB92DRAFT_2853958, partial [Gautieria morchelliformis]
KPPEAEVRVVEGILRAGSLAEEKGSRNCKRKAENLSHKLYQEVVHRHNSERDHDDVVFVTIGCTHLTSPMQRCQCREDYTMCHIKRMQAFRTPPIFS